LGAAIQEVLYMYATVRKRILESLAGEEVKSGATLEKGIFHPVYLIIILLMILGCGIGVNVLLGSLEGVGSPVILALGAGFPHVFRLMIKTVIRAVVDDVGGQTMGAKNAIKIYLG